MNLFKALIPGALLTWIVCSIIGRNGSRGGVLAIETVLVQDYTLHWSWPLFVAATGLAWVIFWALD